MPAAVLDSHYRRYTIPATGSARTTACTRLVRRYAYHPPFPAYLYIALTYEHHSYGCVYVLTLPGDDILATLGIQAMQRLYTAIAGNTPTVPTPPQTPTFPVDY